MLDLQELKVLIIDTYSQFTNDILKYEENYGNLSASLENCYFYTKYISCFNHNIDYQYPEEYENVFDSKILLQLMAASFTAEYSFRLTESGKTDLLLFAEYENESAFLSIGEMDIFQIGNLFMIYVCEQMINFNRFKDSDFIKTEIESAQNSRILKFHNEIVPQLKQDIRSFEIMTKFSKK